jgi:hypothetical protein
LLDQDHLQFSDQEAEYGANRNHEHLVVFENGAEDGF